MKVRENLHPFVTKQDKPRLQYPVRPRRQGVSGGKVSKTFPCSFFSSMAPSIFSMPYCQRHDFHFFTAFSAFSPHLALICNFVPNYYDSFIHLRKVSTYCVKDNVLSTQKVTNLGVKHPVFKEGTIQFGLRVGAEVYRNP